MKKYLSIGGSTSRLRRSFRFAIPGLTLTFYLSLIFWSSTVRAQDTVDTTFNSQMNYIFANVDKSRVPYGILRDYGMEFTALDQFNGLAALSDSNNADINSFWDVYNSLLSSRVSSVPTFFSRQGNLDSAWFGFRQLGRITLMGMFVNYSEFAANAANNTITITNNRLYDKFVNGRWQIPYISNRVFNVCPSISEYDRLAFDVLLPSVLFLKNVSTYSLAIDFGDGQGYRPITAGTPVTLIYSDTGYYSWTYKATVAGSTYYCKSKMHLTNGSSTALLMAAGLLDKRRNSNVRRLPAG